MVINTSSECSISKTNSDSLDFDNGRGRCFYFKKCIICTCACIACCLNISRILCQVASYLCRPFQLRVMVHVTTSWSPDTRAPEPEAKFASCAIVPDDDALNNAEAKTEVKEPEAVKV